MKRLVLLFLLAVTPAHAANDTPRAAVQAIYAPYASLDSDPASSWARPLFSADTAALIRQWRAVAPTDEIDDLSGADWFCQCQDWQASTFRITITRVRMASQRRAEVEVIVHVSGDYRPRARLILLREGDRWLLDDMFDQSFTRGLKAQLRTTIAADRALAPAR